MNTSSTGGTAADALVPSSLQILLHRLNNQLGVVLAHAELLEVRATLAAERASARDVIDGTLGAMATVRAIRHTAVPPVE